MSKITAGLYEEPEGNQAGEYVQLADSKWYHKDIVKELTMDRAAEAMVEDTGMAWDDEHEVIIDHNPPKMNPKYIRAQKDGKVRMECLITSVLASEANVLAHGADKYGARNWRKDEILASTYEGAMMRHLFAWINGEDIDPDSGEPHLSHLRACAAVVMDADHHNKLIDDRDRMESKNG
jgi:hypothetical protein